MPHRNSFCLFRKGTVWLAVPAKVLREVLPLPKIVPLPRTRPILAGLCHLRSEFVPVLRLTRLLPDEPHGGEQFVLLIDDSGGDWGILVDEVHSLVAVEPSHAPEGQSGGWESTVIGWATIDQEIVRILDPQRFRELAELELKPSENQQNYLGQTKAQPAMIAGA